jgi:hypothetical protein
MAEFEIAVLSPPSGGISTIRTILIFLKCSAPATNHCHVFSMG